ncbi:5-(carboxyamino)imidazole ribonucleotide synthase [Lichenihabitans sp. Uapishka_5]|uniref:5-(carboxyamino)imidazole ribonucleotide synthase n=1 Tax=Lichenihabitans sp. Uapishka_5 TaxID=3037302 RepID=UPI0029E7E46C|nr:5-(carboxyamino)imidazole ribonucleotide synthase [Lichenihabitans sp. Uapishka_5]MDX7953187.1 5-(carboxyamino)imidazole ribonucleotide synthase [Lichenihabitans sp. Uapishka_5]
MTARILQPGDTVGILGGGQLARMLALAAAELGLKVHVYAPPGDNPAFEVAAASTLGAYEDAEALARFARAVSVVTYEFENVPADTVAAIAPHCPVRPNGHALAITQDRLLEKRFLRDLGLPTAPFAAVDGSDDLGRAVETLGRPAILKTRRFGYDGKGQIVLRDGTDLVASGRDIGGPAILEGFVPFGREVSVVAARSLDGAFQAFDLCENRHRDGILDTTSVPATVAPDTAAEAIAMTRRIAEALDYVGVLAVEMFVVPGPDGAETLMVNEIAPRVHNSGHWTSDGAVTSQFAQQIRAVCGWPLGDTARFGTVLMQNLIGDDAAGWARHLATPGACLHLYGKAEARPGRKMGHVTTVTPFRAD